MFLVKFGRESRQECRYFARESDAQTWLATLDESPALRAFDADIEQVDSAEVVIPGGKRTVRFKLPRSVGHDTLALLGEENGEGYNTLCWNPLCRLIENALQEQCIMECFVLFHPFTNSYYNVR